MKDNIIDYLIIGIIVVFVVLMLFLDTKFPNNSSNEEKHKCTTFVKYKEHYQITPMTWYYRDSFKCIEFGGRIMKIMISQPMNGKTEEQIRKERAKLVKELEKQGHEIIDTIFTDEVPEGYDTGIYYLSKSIRAIGKADAVVFMEGWEQARGCRIENQVALAYGKFIKIL